MELLKALLPSAEHVQFQGYELDRAHRRITVSMSSMQSTAACSLCAQSAHRVHSHYERTLADLAWSNYQVLIRLEVRKFFCDNPLCQRRIFSERIASVVAPWARRTLRLGAQLREIALSLGGAAGARLSQKLHCGTSRNTLLRLLLKLPLPNYETPTRLGVDDFALRKGQSYGTILVDLDRRRPIALWAGREAAPLADWLNQHPGIGLLSRDRSVVYKSGMTQGAPDAVQVADRFHLIHNLAEVLEQVVRSRMSEVRQMTVVDRTPADSESEAGIEATTAVPEIKSAASVPLQSHYQQRRMLHRLIWHLHEQGWSSAAIAVHAGVSIRTVQRDLNKPKFADAQRRADYGKSLVAPYRAYILQRYTPGGRRPRGLLEALRKQGYRGSDRTLRRYLSQLSRPELIEDKLEAEAVLPLPSIPQILPQPSVSQLPLSAKQVTWLVLRTSTQYTAEEEQILTALQSKTSPVALAIELAQGFARLIRQRQPEQFEAWLEQASESKITAFVNFAKGLKEDFDAVKAAMTLSASNGAVEGQINRLKALKRQMYGRAGIELLSRRFLLAS